MENMPLRAHYEREPCRRVPVRQFVGAIARVEPMGLVLEVLRQGANVFILELDQEPVVLRPVWGKAPRGTSGLRTPGRRYFANDLISTG